MEISLVSLPLIINQTPTTGAKVKTIEQLLDPNKTQAEFETCKDPAWGKKVFLKNKNNQLKSGQKISEAVTTFYDANNNITGYYAGYYNKQANEDVMGIFFDKSGQPVATLGKPGENITYGSFINIYDFNNPDLKLGRLYIYKFSSSKAGPNIQFFIENLNNNSVFKSKRFSGEQAFEFSTGYDPHLKSYLGAIANINPQGKVTELLGLIKWDCSLF